MGSFFQALLSFITAPLRILLTVPAKLAGGSRRLGSLSMPAQVAIIMAIVLIIIFVVAAVVAVMNPDSANLWPILIKWFLVLGALIVVIPLVLYKALMLWLEGPVSRYPAIDAAWKAGMAALSAKGLDIRQIPLYLVIGSASEEQERATFRASGREFLVNGATDEEGRALLWYANSKAIYVVCSRTSCLSMSARSMFSEKEKDGVDDKSDAVESASGGKTIICGSGGIASPRGDSSHGGILNTVTQILGKGRRAAQTDSELVPSPTVTLSSAQPAGDSGSPTIMPPRPSQTILGTIILQVGHIARGSGRKDQSSADPIKDTQGCFEYVCQLIRRAREPYAPINGVLVLLPFFLTSSRKPGVKDLLFRALKTDIEQVLTILMLRCPVLVLVTEMDDEAGFMEFVRRLAGQLGAAIAQQRFGAGFPTEVQLTEQRLHRLAAQARHRFEVFVYGFYCAPEALKRLAGNRSLYGFLCRIRRTTENLKTILRAVYELNPGLTSQQKAVGELVFFSGCYFGGTGPTPERQSFVKGWFDKADEHEDDLEWTDAALRQDARYRLLGQVGLAVDTLLLIGVIAAGLWLWHLYSSTQ